MGQVSSSFKAHVKKVSSPIQDILQDIIKHHQFQTLEISLEAFVKTTYKRKSGGETKINNDSLPLGVPGSLSTWLT